MPHPDVTTIEAFIQRRLAPADALALSNHLAECEECHDTVLSLSPQNSNIEWFPAEDDCLHLSEEELADAAMDENRLGPEALAHLRGCAACREEVTMVREPLVPLAATPARRPTAKIFVLWPVWASALAACLVMAVYVAHRQTPASENKPAMVAELRDGNGQIGLDSQGTVTGDSQLSPEYLALIANTLQTRRLPASNTAIENKATPESLRGDASSAPAFKVLSPQDETTTTQPTFTWEAFPAAKSYRVEVYDSHFKLATASDALTTTSWSPAKPLANGETFTWIVKAVSGNQVAQSPVPPQREARFVVATAATLTTIESARSEFKNQHLLLAALYARAGMRAMASEEIGLLEKENPNSAIVLDLKTSLQEPAARPQLPPSKTNPAQ